MTKEYHILSLSGGKDSTALAFFMRDNMPEIFNRLKLVFYDTGCELPETYDYLNKIEIFLNKKITKVKPEKSFEEIFATNPILPSPFKRWCTVLLKVKPSINHIKSILKRDGLGNINLYVGIRGDERQRKGVQLTSKLEQSYIKPTYPFIENNIIENDVNSILFKIGIGLPKYYEYKKRNGCYFCFYQTPLDWVNLYEKHPKLFFKALEYEKKSYIGKVKQFNWNQEFSLPELIKPENIIKIKEKYKKLALKKENLISHKLIEQF